MSIRCTAPHDVYREMNELVSHYENAPSNDVFTSRVFVHLHVHYGLAENDQDLSFVQRVQHAWRRLRSQDKYGLQEKASQQLAHEVIRHVFKDVKKIFKYAALVNYEEDPPQYIQKILDRKKELLQMSADGYLNPLEVLKATNALLQWSKAHDICAVWQVLTESIESEPHPLLLDFFARGDIGSAEDVQQAFSDWFEAHKETLITSVTELDLDGRCLESLPEELWQLTALEFLSLEGNRLRVLPAGIGELRELKLLNLTGNDLISLPQELGHLTQLEKLDVIGNALTELPEEIGALHALKELCLSDNGLTAIPLVLCSLSTLKVLQMSGNQLDALPWQLNKLSELRVLKVRRNQLKTVPWELGDLKHLEELDLSQNRLRGIPADFFRLIHLRELDLSHNRITQLLPTAIMGLKRLTVLNLAHNQLQQLPTQMGRLTQLRLLDLTGNLLESFPTFLFHLVNATISVRKNPLQIKSLALIYYALGNPNYNGPRFTGFFEVPYRGFNPQNLSVSVAFWLKAFQGVFPKDRFPELHAPGHPEIIDPGSYRFLQTYSVLLNDDEHRDRLVQFLRKASTLRDFLGDRGEPNPPSLPGVVLKVYRMITGSVISEAFRTRMLEHIEDAIESCEDRMAIGFNAIEVLWHIYLGIETLETQEERDLALAEFLIGHHRTEVLNSLALQRAGALGLKDEIEIILCYQIALRDLLRLPLSIEGMAYPGMATAITQEMLDQDARRVIDATSSQQQVIDILAQHEAWHTKFEQRYLAEAEEIREEIMDRMNALMELGAAEGDEQERLRGIHQLEREAKGRISQLVHDKTTTWVQGHMHQMRDPFINPNANKRKRGGGGGLPLPKRQKLFG